MEEKDNKRLESGRLAAKGPEMVALELRMHGKENPDARVQIKE